jgi:hypothetical protein
MALIVPATGVFANQQHISNHHIPNHHAPYWERFSQNHHFTTGPDFRSAFGDNTTIGATFTFHPDTSSANIRRDRHAADQPLPHGAFSGFVPTPPVNPLFADHLQQTNRQQHFTIQQPFGQQNLQPSHLQSNQPTPSAVITPSQNSLLPPTPFWD